jgi:hypothetical protein
LRGAGAASLAAAAIAAEQIARPASAQAATNYVVLGQSNTSTGNTDVVNTAGGIGLAGEALGSGIGVFAGSDSGDGVRAGSNSGNAITAISKQGVGVYGHSLGHWGVFAQSDTDTALQAESAGGVGIVGVGKATGIYGQHGSTNGFASTSDGVRGFTDDPQNAGVRGENANGGNGLSGSTKSGASGRAAVDGTNDGAGPGVRGAGGTGVLAEAKGSGAVALRVNGPAMFSTAGTLTIGAGASKATKTGVALTSASLALATLQETDAGAYVMAAVPDVAASSFTVHLNKAATKKVTVAWFIVN